MILWNWRSEWIIVFCIKPLNVCMEWRNMYVMYTNLLFWKAITLWMQDGVDELSITHPTPSQSQSHPFLIPFYHTNLSHWTLDERISGKGRTEHTLCSLWLHTIQKQEQGLCNIIINISTAAQKLRHSLALTPLTLVSQPLSQSAIQCSFTPMM